jgi:hypothetical protein
MSKAAHPAEAVFKAVSQFIAQSRRELEAGEIVDLTDLDKYVQALCEAILELSQEDRLHYADSLQQLLGDVTALGEELTEKRDVLAGEINQVSRHAKASSAYRIVDAIDALVKKVKL